MDGVTLRKAHSAPHLDWPLSAEEKKGCVLRLYDKDVQAANELIRSSEERLEALQMQLAKTRNSADSTLPSDVSEQSTPVPKVAPNSGISKPVAAEQPAVVDADDTEDAADKLRAAIATATAALQELESAKGKKDQSNRDSESPRCSQSQHRSRSEGPLVGILCKDPQRRSRGSSMGGEKRRVSFGTVDADDIPVKELVESPERSTSISQIKHKSSVQESPAHASGVEPEPELFAPDWVGEAAVASASPNQAAKNSDSTAVPWRPSIPPVTREGSERWQRHLSKSGPQHSADADSHTSHGSAGKGSSKEQAQRQRSSETAAATAATRQQRASGGSTPRRGQQVNASAGTPKRTGRVWRPPART
mmetsp:Transcript_41982/g.74230  ORF Transcript_41982/g.74230 Transcript_41982/m.74230 type:complete len:363 (-) Transcript_41982:75-1163(-)